MCCPGRSDPCIHSPVEGEGPLQLTRYYFDAVSRQCQEFSFRGLKGNPNNFITKEQCELHCPVQINPCPISFNSLKYSVTLNACSASHTCPERQWCHVGETKETTVCCPNAVPDPCTAPPRNPGIGDFHATRWAFDGSIRKCIPFEYRGMKGNANNFINREICEKRCPGGDPCGQPLDRGQGTSQLSRWYWNVQSQCCLPFSYCGMRGTQNNFLTKSDCERTCYVDNNAICQQPMSMGSGEASLSRWYYDAINKRCVQFIYKGRYGNQNNFLTQQDCEQNCAVYVNVCPIGIPLLDYTNRPVPCTFGSNSCGFDHWCHLGLVPDEYQCCPGKPVNPTACQGLPLIEGELGAPASAATRYYYDQAEMKCKQFIYNGRKGNQNNFLTKEDCEKTCEVFTNPCTQPISLPPQTCATIGPDTCGINAWCHIGATPDTTLCCPSEGDPCTLPLNHGTGNQFMDRWYFNQQTGTCSSFIYAGIRGNQNNFLSKEVGYS
uniref:Kunitz/Bovine pancreatic trypsin inhibitor domain protein n=1 Tax=Heterorhabditis bacteriophora TaxID=37862 RepID=A0A1I7XLK6_HETBA